MIIIDKNPTHISEFWDWKDILTPYGQHTRDCDATYPHSCFSHGSSYLTTEHNYFNKTRRNHQNHPVESRISIQNMDWVVKETYWPLTGNKLKNMTLLKPSLVWVYYEIVISIKWEAELPKIMMNTNSWNWTKGRHTLTPHGPLPCNVMLPAPILVWVSMPTYKHNHLKLPKIIFENTNV